MKKILGILAGICALAFFVLFMVGTWQGLGDIVALPSSSIRYSYSGLLIVIRTMAGQCLLGIMTIFAMQTSGKYLHTRE